MSRLREAALAEFIGTFALCFLGIGAVCANRWTGGGVGWLGVAIAHGATLAVMISALGHVSGGHFNPAVTVGLLGANQITGARALVYLVAQLAGAVAAAWLLTVVIPQPVWNMVRLGTPTVVGTISVAQALLIEGVLTFFLVTAVLGTAVDPQGSWHAVAGFGIGTVLLVCLLMGGPFTGGCLNPARAFGPALVSGTFRHQLVYWLGPLSGGLVAALVYSKAFLRSSRRK